MERCDHEQYQEEEQDSVTIEEDEDPSSSNGSDVGMKKYFQLLIMSERDQWS